MSLRAKRWCKPVVDYLKAVLDKEGIESKIFTRTNLAARLKGNGKRKPLLIVGPTDTVNIDAKKWTHGLFSAHREGGHVYGRGTLDDKDNLAAALYAQHRGADFDRSIRSLG